MSRPLVLVGLLVGLLGADVQRDGDRLVVDPPIAFSGHTAELTKDALTSVEAVKSWLAAHPEVASLEVGGHTDNTWMDGF